MTRTIQASAPGSLMLLGEHAVLHGRRCLVSAVTSRLQVSITARKDSRIAVTSELGDHVADLSNFRIAPPHTFLLSAIDQHRAHLEDGLDVRIESTFSEKVGLGSSAAVTVACHAALSAQRGGILALEDLFERSLRTIREVQGVGSGADAAASVWGGIVAYRAEPRSVTALPHICPLTAVYSGSKTPTPEVVAIVEAAREKDPQSYDELFDAMDASAGQAIEAVTEQDWPRLGEILNINQGLMDALGVGTQTLSDIVDGLRAAPGIHGAKISGSGLGDCVVGLGKVEADRLDFPVLKVDSSPEGVRIDS